MTHTMQLRWKTKRKQPEQPDETKQQEQASKYNATDIVGFTMFLNNNQNKHPICIVEDVGVDHCKPHEVWYRVRHLNVNDTIDSWIVLFILFGIFCVFVNNGYECKILNENVLKCEFENKMLNVNVKCKNNYG